MSSKYVIGLDYGTLSCRAVLARCKDGEIIADAVKPYTHQVMEELLPDGKTALERNWALEHPGDYLESMEDTIRSVMAVSYTHLSVPVENAGVRKRIVRH